MWEGKQIVAKCYGQNQLSLYENRCRIWKNKTIDHIVQKVWIPPSIHNTSPMYIYIYIYIYIYTHIYISILTAIWLPTANFGPLSRGQPHSHNVNNCIFFFKYSTRRSPGASQRGWVPKPGQAPTGVWTGNLLILITML